MNIQSNKYRLFFLLKLIYVVEKLDPNRLHVDLSHNSLKNNYWCLTKFNFFGCALYIGVYFFQNYQPQTWDAHYT